MVHASSGCFAMEPPNGPFGRDRPHRPLLAVTAPVLMQQRFERCSLLSTRSAHLRIGWSWGTHADPAGPYWMLELRGLRRITTEEIHACRTGRCFAMAAPMEKMPSRAAVVSGPSASPWKLRRCGVVRSWTFAAGLGRHLAGTGRCGRRLLTLSTGSIWCWGSNGETCDCAGMHPPTAGSDERHHPLD